MKKSSWREVSRPIIYKVLQSTQGLTDKEIRKALREAYPFGQRSMLPYKMWLDEIKKQRLLKSNKKQPLNQLQLF